MFGFGKATRACTKAVEIISPLVAGSSDRLGAIASGNWQNPYLIGYMTMQISLIVKAHTEGKIGEEQLGLVQQDAWSRITGQNHDVIGETICMLSVGRDAAFSSGCENALHFMTLYMGQDDFRPSPEPDQLNLAQLEFSGEDLTLYGRGGPLAHVLWIRYFDDHIA